MLYARFHNHIIILGLLGYIIQPISAQEAMAAAPVAPAAEVRPPRPPAPVRAPDGPEAPNFTVVGAEPGGAGFHAAAGVNPPPERDGDFLIGPDYLPAPELKVVAGVPHGTVQQFTLDSAASQFYPGMAREALGTADPHNAKTMIVQTHPAPYQRTVTVYIPAQYQPGQSAPFLLTHDGPALGKPDLSVPHILDNLIVQKRVPVLIAIAVAHGGGDAQGSERGLEYDTMSGRFAEFIQAEVLPAVEKAYKVRLTTDPEGRATMGSSSGGAAALAMAWYHPEWYHRVITYSGTYVNQQWPFNPDTPDGAWDFHEKLLPQNPRRPLRIWLEVGDRDNYNPNALRDGMHDWVIANHRMAAVLRAKGYHYQYTFALNAGHTDRAVRAQTLPEALEYIWKDYRPAP